MNEALRNTLRNAVNQCRKLLEGAIAEVLEGRFGIDGNGRVQDAGEMTNLSAEEHRFRDELLAHLRHIQDTLLGDGPISQNAVEQLKREVGFTHLNRLCAFKILEQRKLIREAVGRGLRSNGFKFYLADHPEDERRWSGGEQEIAYRHFLAWLAGTFSEEVGALFSPHDPANWLFPAHLVLEQVLGLINDTALRDVWDDDETIGWIYQYFTPKELRDRAREESAAPRNSYEMAFRNQFYTPRYVVRFLVDNTLGRIWYEMRQGETRLAERCDYLVRRERPVFLARGERTPEANRSDGKRIEEYVPHRDKRDPARSGYSIRPAAAAISCSTASICSRSFIRKRTMTPFSARRCAATFPIGGSSNMPSPA